ncbi:unnamed protein product [Didymodactylos carnosus]|uniref:B box-type domain-containing protein n=1 Tax=Didymodactylos carnosus TaxID=1234261 RepID=A0A815IEN4_9BILA|nr:unnamed protein product [Didymodactylos carnosus]CAF1364922.1 unnamed protein product [Didymodactylos carnosus]CAF4074868.1 unnamed protein product [Didymodactylos carnosus]CAF4246533.1 unnamed protein product [Didymodactylos carnosus]
MEDSSNSSNNLTSRKCGICSKNPGVLVCVGCNLLFCRQDYNDHRQKLSRELKTILSERDLLEQKLIAAATTAVAPVSSSKILGDIEQWENDMHAKIRAAADCAREKVDYLINKDKDEPVRRLKAISDDIHPRISDDEYVENDLVRWRKEIQRIQNAITEQVPTITLDTKQSLSINWSRIINVQQMKKPNDALHSATSMEKLTKISKKTDVQIATSVEQSKKNSSRPQTAISEHKLVVNIDNIKTEPKLRVNIRGMYLAASADHLICFSEQKLHLIDASGNEKMTHVWNHGATDACWSEFLKQFLFFGSNGAQLYAFDVETHKVRAVQKFARARSLCSCSREKLIISGYDHDTTSSCIEEYELTNWKYIQEWHPPHSARKGEIIRQIRFSSTGSQTGLIIESNRSRFELRDQLMRILRSVTLDENSFDFELLAFPNRQYLISSRERIKSTKLSESDTLNTKFYFFDTDGRLKIVRWEKNSSSTHIALMNQICLVTGVEHELRFYDL